MIGPEAQHPRSVLKRKLVPSVPTAPEVPAKRSLPEVVDIVSEVCSYETISDYIEMFGNDTLEQEQGGSPASLESGYQTAASVPDEEDSNLSWLLNFKVSSLFDPTEDSPPARREETCLCNGVGYQRTGSGKPPFTYTELIEKALKEQGQLTVSGIYSWISSKYPFYSPNDDRWKNSVRHNLSINPHFRKGLKSRHGAGHLWTLSNEGVNPPPDSWKRARTVMQSAPPEPVDEAALAAATIMQLEDEESTTSALTVPDCDPALPLHRVAEEILNGVKRQVEVQYLVHDHNSSEFINPVSKEEIVSESGLDTSHCEAASSLLSDLNTELHLPDNLFSDELAFPCYSQL